MNISLILLALAAAEPVEFARDVLPILSENCFHCHGPDDSSRKKGLRLDTRDGAFATRKGKTMLVAGKPDVSEVILRVLDADNPMPPVDSHRTLSEKQKQTLKTWVEQGAKWGTHWAYVPLPKTVPGAGIDRFIRERLKKEGLVPSGPAERTTWLRRVTLDLTGLPPTVAEIDAFVKDGDYEKVVDRLLKSSRYGERMATDWLDVARFADTLGYQHDRPQPMWPYRDWVINAFNANMPYDRFVTEQLAGDLLPKATQNQKLATAFNRLHMQNEEGGIVEEEFRVAYVADRVNTFGTAFLGQTFECTRCHDHKYDPFTQKDYYSLFAAFQNIAEAGQTSYFTTAMNTPTLLLTTAEQEREIVRLNSNVEYALQRLRTVRTLSDEEFNDWMLKVKNREELALADLVGHYSFDFKSDQPLKNKAAEKHHGKLIGSPKHEMIDKDPCFTFDGENGIEFPGLASFSKSDYFTVGVALRLESIAPRAVVFHRSRAPIDAGSRGYECTLENGHITFSLNHSWPGNSLKVHAVKPLETKKWHFIIINYDGSSRASGVEIILDDEVLKTAIDQDSLSKDILYDGTQPNFTLGTRFRDNGLKGGSIGGLIVGTRRITAAEVGFIGFDAWTEAQKRTFFLDTADNLSRKRKQELREARRELAKYVEPIPEIMVMDELPAAKPAFVLKRGQYDQPGEKVSIDTPKSLPPMDAALPKNRLGLATWLTHPDHPLTARVAVNRLWQQMFGRGLVETSENFGTTGSMPTHPELLDWLARDFVDHGWDMKRMLKMIALSETYRQSSRTTNEVRSKDPYNTLLSHMPPRRLTAEMLRDQALFASGLLKEKLGGPSVFPIQPEGLWNDAMGKPKYPTSKGDDLHRRSLYTHWKRTAPPPGMSTFDAADRQNCAMRRQSTATPLQALVLLNDPQMAECAKELAKLPVETMFLNVTGRAMTADEAKLLKDLKPTDAALVTLNHDEAVNRR